ncbi:MAG TPA: hypothetical protein DF383_02540 [Deltaproteobacteria bacterium]|nr:hypothetical protein [Deltaproteobacteria bacterium]
MISVIFSAKPGLRMKTPRDSKKAAKHRPMGPLLKRFFLWASLAIVGSFGLLTVFSDNGILDLIRLKTLHRSIQEENFSLLREQDELRAEIERLQDPRYLEYLARERFGFMRSDEIFIVLDKPAAAPPFPD